VVLNVVPAVLYLLNRRNFGFSPVESKLWLFFSFAALGLLVLLVALPSSTAVDRLALYVIPIQVAVWSRVPIAYKLRRLGRVAVVAFAAAILFTWLNFGVFSRSWIPYQVYPVFS